MNRAHTQLPCISVQEAIELLKVHSYECEDPYDPRMNDGLLASLRAYNGPLNHRAFHEVMACIKAVGPSFSKGDLVERRPISSLWGIYHLGISYIADPARQQRRKELLKPEELGVEEKWLDCIGYAVLTFLQMDDPDEAFTLYEGDAHSPAPMGDDG